MHPWYGKLSGIIQCKTDSLHGHCISVPAEKPSCCEYELLTPDQNSQRVSLESWR